MTDAQISYALARAIGWPFVMHSQIGEYVLVGYLDRPGCMHFDYRDRTVWAGLVEGYGPDCSPLGNGGWGAYTIEGFAEAETPAKAIALLVIELARQGKLPERKV